MRHLASLALAFAMLFSLAPATSAATTNDLEHLVLDQVNAARAARGLVKLRSDSRLWADAGDRATTMATTNVLSHTVAGSLSAGLNARHISWYGVGETIAYSSGGRTAAVAKALVTLWHNSPPHWTLLMSDKYNYVGVGLAYRSSNRRLFGSVVLTESKDHSGARATITGATRTGDDIAWTWRASDLALQTHTAGLRDITVQMRRDRGGWVTILAHTTTTSRLSPNKVHGHWYGLRVRATDRSGNVGPWSAERRVWVP
jgi:uncharacterized protein YkwD